MLNTFLSILAVVGIVAVSAFVIIFLCDLFISIVDGSNGIFFKRHKDEEEEDPSRPRLLKQPKEEAQEEVQEEEVQEEAQEEVKEEEPAQEPVKEEKVEEKVEEPVEEKTEEPAKENVEEVIATVSEKTKEELAAEEKEQELVKANEDLARQIEELKAQIAELQNKEPEAQAAVETVPADSKEAIEARLEVLKQRLKENEKELSTNRKEYIPLRRVNMTLESDKKKLRRKEAIVAKRKVVLYGVNNYVDIDEEKAKELNEELELLEGLRLSVAHCEEVMEKNKDRYPILERANNFLTKNQEDLKADIAELEAKLKALEEAEPAEAPAAEGEEAPKADAE